MMYMLKKLLNINKIISPLNIFETRNNTCKNCEFYRKILKQCKICKCFIPLKARIIITSCPIGKWDNPYNEW